jgi:hypothetical protein
MFDLSRMTGPKEPYPRLGLAPSAAIPDLQLFTRCISRDLDGNDGRGSTTSLGRRYFYAVDPDQAFDRVQSRAQTTIHEECFTELRD